LGEKARFYWLAAAPRQCAASAAALLPMPGRPDAAVTKRLAGQPGAGTCVVLIEHLLSNISDYRRSSAALNQTVERIKPVRLSFFSFNRSVIV
jgi:hypothetical protein